MSTVRRLLHATLLALLLTGIATAIGVATPAAQGKTRAERIVSLARVELAKGVREIPDGSNRAPAIRRYVGSTTPSWFGAPWCAYFVSYVARGAGVPIGPSGRGLGYVPYIVTWAKRTRRWRTRPRPGYLVTWPNHVGIVETVSSNGTMTTIEGNAANAVRRRYRRTTDAQGFVALGAGGRITAPSKAPRRPRPARREAKLRPRITFYPSDRVRVGGRLEVSANDSSGPVERVRWDLDADGRFDDARGDTASMRVRRAGRFRIAMRIYSRSGRRATTRRMVTVLGAKAPSARLDLPARATVGAPVVADASRSRGPGDGPLRFGWDVDGDGRFVVGAERETVTFTAPGVHEVAVRVRAGNGAWDEKRRLIEVSAPVVPVVGLSCDRPAVATGERVACAVDTSGVTRRVARIEWDVDGSGTYLRGSASRRLSYATPGRREIAVRVTDRDGRQATASTGVEVHNRAPVVDLRAPAAGREGSELLLDASRSADPDGRIVGTRWDVGADGTWDGEGPQHVLRPVAPGPLRVRVETVDDLGAASAAEITVEVLPPLVAVAEVLTADPRVRQEVWFTARSSTGGPFARCLWDTDGNGRTDISTSDCAGAVRRTFKRAGTYTGTLTVVAADGHRATTTYAVTVR